MTDWVPKSGHVSQLQLNPNTGGLDGREDCGPACLVRYLREGGKLPTDTTVSVELNMMRELINGIPDLPGQSGTSTTDLEMALAHYGVNGTWTTSFAVCQAAAFSIMLVDDPPTPNQYPDYWLGSADHWILWLPKWKGAINWFNDPLAYNNGQSDCQYDLGSVQANFLGGIVLPDVPGVVSALQRGHVKEACTLKVQANKTCGGLARIPGPPHGEFLYLGQEKTDQISGLVYTRIQFTDKIGWIRKDNAVKGTATS